MAARGMRLWGMSTKGQFFNVLNRRMLRGKESTPAINPPGIPYCIPAMITGSRKKMPVAYRKILFKKMKHTAAIKHEIITGIALIKECRIIYFSAIALLQQDP
jgi:hypothetical protein